MNKVCFITTVHPLDDVRIFHKEIKTLIKSGYDVTLIVQHDKQEIIDRVKIIPLPSPKNRFFRICFLTIKAYKMAKRQKADIYHFHDPEFLPWAMILKIKTRAKIIYDVHEDYPKQILSKHWIPIIIRGPIAFLFNILEKLISNKIDFIITVDERIKKKFKTTKSDTVKNFPILDNFQLAKNKESDEFTLIYVGGICEIRGITQLVQVMEYVPNNIKLILCGQIATNYEKKIKRLKGFQKVQYLGDIPYNKIPFYLSQGDVGMMCYLPTPNYYNLIEPVKLFEYMAAGLPVISSNFPYLKTIIKKNNCGLLVNPLNLMDIKKAIEYLQKNRSSALQMGENGTKAVLKKYNWENEGKKLLKIYENLITTI